MVPTCGHAHSSHTPQATLSQHQAHTCASLGDVYTTLHANHEQLSDSWDQSQVSRHAPCTCCITKAFLVVSHALVRDILLIRPTPALWKFDTSQLTPTHPAQNGPHILHRKGQKPHTITPKRQTLRHSTSQEVTRHATWSQPLIRWSTCSAQFKPQPRPVLCPLWKPERCRRIDRAGSTQTPLPLDTRTVRGSVRASKGSPS